MADTEALTTACDKLRESVVTSTPEVESSESVGEAKGK